MPDSKDINSTDPLSEFDMDATVQLNLGKDGNLISTSAVREITPDDFEKTIDGLFEIEEMLGTEQAAKDNENIDGATPVADEIDFDGLNADIEALTRDEAPQTVEEPGETAAADENEFLMPEPKLPEPKKQEKSYKGLPLLGGDEAESEPEAVAADKNEFLMPEPENVEQPTPEGETPVIELTEEMLNEPADELAEAENAANISDIPELTTTERHVISDATAAIKELEEEDRIGRHPVEPSFATPAAPQPVEVRSGGSGIFPVLLGLLGIAAGGFGAWMAFDASNQVEDMKRQIQSLDPAAAAKQNQKIADVQQRLGKIERRLTGTPTIEAAAPLMSTGEEAEKTTAVTQADKPTVRDITPATEITNTKTSQKSPAQTKAGGWVINLSSHTKESLATKELNRLKRLGLDAEMHSAMIKNRTWYRIQITGFASKEEASAQLNDVRQKSGLRDIWIGKK